MGDKYCSYPENDLTEELRQMAVEAFLMTHTNQECTGQLSGMVNRRDGRAAWGTITLGLLTGDTPRIDRGRKDMENNCAWQDLSQALLGELSV